MAVFAVQSESSRSTTAPSSSPAVPAAAAAAGSTATRAFLPLPSPSPSPSLPGEPPPALRLPLPARDKAHRTDQRGRGQATHSQQAACRKRRERGGRPICPSPTRLPRQTHLALLLLWRPPPPPPPPHCRCPAAPHRHPSPAGHPCQLAPKLPQRAAPQVPPARCHWRRQLPRAAPPALQAGPR